MNKVNKLKFPLLEGPKSVYPESPVCSVCKKPKVSEPHEFVILAGGAIQFDEDGAIATPAHKLMGFFDIVWHGAHESPQDILANETAFLPIVKNSIGGQFEIYFCSTHCLKQFFRLLIDQIETRVEAAKNSKAITK